MWEGQAGLFPASAMRFPRPDLSSAGKQESVIGTHASSTDNGQWHLMAVVVDAQGIAFYQVQDSGGFRAQGSGSRVHSLRFGVQGSGFKVLGFGFRASSWVLCAISHRTFFSMHHSCLAPPHPHSLSPQPRRQGLETMACAAAACLAASMASAAFLKRGARCCWRTGRSAAEPGGDPAARHRLLWAAAPHRFARCRSPR